MFQLRNITAGYGSTVVLSNVTVAVPPGSVVALLGANGAGKTTLLRVASGLLRPASGDILFEQQQLAGKEPHNFARQGLCHIPEGRGIFRTMTVRDNLLLQAPPGGEEHAIDKAVTIFPVLGDRMNQIAGTLSGGQQQMLALTRAYLSNPSYVFLDEVSLGLAPKLVDEVFEFMARLADEGVALLLVEQFVVRALKLANYAYILNRGRIVFAGEPGELNEGDVFSAYLGADIV